MSLLSIEPQYTIRWRNWGETITLYAYDPESRSLEIVRVEEDLFRIGHSTTQDSWAVINQVGLYANVSGRLDIGWLTNRTRVNSFPRIEIVRTVADTARPIATLFPDGTLIVPDASEAEIPDGDDQLILFDKISFSPAGLIADEIREVAL
jgi:hypothetical protein